jgi:hypothetical protein
VGVAVAHPTSTTWRNGRIGKSGGSGSTALGCRLGALEGFGGEWICMTTVWCGVADCGRHCEGVGRVLLAKSSRGWGAMLPGWIEVGGQG